MKLDDIVAHATNKAQFVGRNRRYSAVFRRMYSHSAQYASTLLRPTALASSNEGDLVIDPFSGSGTTVVVSEQPNRRWMGCDFDTQYNQWAIKRIENVRRMTKEEWITFDRKTAERRESIR